MCCDVERNDRFFDERREKVERSHGTIIFIRLVSPPPGGRRLRILLSFPRKCLPVSKSLRGDSETWRLGDSYRKNAPDMLSRVPSTNCDRDELEPSNAQHHAKELFALP
jgi:hypothetical protein